MAAVIERGCTTLIDIQPSDKFTSATTIANIEKKTSNGPTTINWKNNH